MEINFHRLQLPTLVYTIVYINNFHTQGWRVEVGWFGVLYDALFGNNFVLLFAPPPGGANSSIGTLTCHSSHWRTSPSRVQSEPRLFHIFYKLISVPQPTIGDKIQTFIIIQNFLHIFFIYILLSYFIFYFHIASIYKLQSFLIGVTVNTVGYQSVVR